MGPSNKNSHLLMVSDLLLPNSNVWNLELIRVILPEYEKCILSLHPSYLALKLEEDLDPFGPRVAPDPFNWKTHIWNLKTSPKTKLLLWKAVTEGIASSSKAICLPPSGLGGGRLSPWLFWTIWSSRNQLIFNKKQTLAEDAYLLAITRAKEWQSANQTQSLPARIPDPLVIPRSHSIDPVCCTDAAWKTEVAEALATLLAIGVAIESGIKRISFASDSLTLVKAINRKFLTKELHRILHDIHSLSISFDACSFFFISRKHNSEADALAKDALLSCINSLI
uniref:Putative non-LTR retroelement reverse transcriptase n=1 Tax=Arabidopsis thaliana TaxID=3702 RepID=Q9ZQD9_ARATH|nr:putative non-LTR retroelement reverse transcriptase [Arabidopsis thaliana]